MLPLNKLLRVVDSFNGVFLSVPERTFSVVVVLNTEICTCCLQFLWGAVFFKIIYCFVFSKLDQPRYIPHWPCI